MQERNRAFLHNPAGNTNGRETTGELEFYYVCEVLMVLRVTFNLYFKNRETKPG